MNDRYLLEWLQQPLGRHLCDLEGRVLDNWVREIYGLRLLQLGNFPWGERNPLLTSPITSRICMAPDARVDGVSTVAADSAQLPFLSESIDLVILPHTLDLCRDPHTVLREVERVLVPGGRIITLNFNPWSLWGIRRLINMPRKKARSPWNIGFTSYIRLSDWFRLLGLEIERTEVMMFNLPVGSDALLSRGAGLERLGRKLWPVLSGVYVVQGIKRVRRLTPPRPYLQRVRQLGSGVLEPTTRGV